MEMLNSFSMMLGSDLWTTLITWFSTWVPKYGWTIIVFTIALKLIMSPLDIYQRISSQKQTRFMRVMQPEMAKLQEKYGNDKEKLNQETAKLYKKHNISMGGMCLSMLLTLGVSMVVFFTLFSSLRAFGDEKLYNNYKELDTVCVTALNGKQVDELTDEELTTVQLTIKEKNNELKDKNSWLWVKNVWKSDTADSQFVAFDAYATNQNLEGKSKDDASARYNLITKTIADEEGEQNGYFILIILAAGVTFLSQFISAKIMTPKGQKLNTTNKVMFAILPISMIIFALNSNVIFSLYIITNSVMSAILSTTITMIMKGKDKGKTDEEILLSNKKVEVVEYSRNYKK